MFNRFLGRIRHGLLIQEILDRLSRLGLTFYPYLLMSERPLATKSDGARLEGFSTRWLTPADIASIADFEERPGQSRKLAERLRMGQYGMGIFAGAELAGYSWCDIHACISIFRRPLFKLNANEACMLDMYIRRRFRGRGLALLLRRALSEAMQEQGRDTFYSVSLFFNASTRRLKDKLNSEPVELRLYVRLGRVWEKDFLLKSYMGRPTVSARQATD